MATRTDPFETMEQFFEQMRRSMTESWDGAGVSALPGGSAIEGAMGAFDGNVSLESTEDGYVVMADLPGFEREEIDVRIVDGRLTIEATHEAGDGESYRSRHVSESVVLPSEVDVDATEASYRNGVLEIHLPVPEDVEDSYTIDIE